MELGPDLVPKKQDNPTSNETNGYDTMGIQLQIGEEWRSLGCKAWLQKRLAVNPTTITL